jgi:hypothetical protein
VPSEYLTDVLTGIVLKGVATAAERRTDRVTVNLSLAVSAITVEAIGAQAATR